MHVRDVDGEAERAAAHDGDAGQAQQRVGVEQADDVTLLGVVERAREQQAAAGAAHLDEGVVADGGEPAHLVDEQPQQRCQNALYSSVSVYAGAQNRRWWAPTTSSRE